MAPTRKITPIVLLILAALLWYFTVALLFVSTTDIDGAKLLSEYQLILMAAVLVSTVILRQVYKATKKSMPEDED